MQFSETTFKKIKNKYLKFIKSQEVLSEPFRDKMGQLKNFYLPICETINNSYLKNKNTRILGLSGGQGQENQQYQTF